MLTPEQIQWCRDTIPGFKAMHDQAEKSRRETEENRQRMSAYLTAANLRRFPEEKAQ